MIAYYGRLALLSLKKNVLLTGLMIAAIGLGIGAAMTTITVNYLMSADPIPNKSDRLFAVQVDNWSPNEAYSEPNLPPDQVTWLEATQLTEVKMAYRQAGMGTSYGVIEPKGQDQKPYLASVRITYADFFPMFEPPFLYGSGWSSQADEARELVIVLSKEANNEIFGGANSVGETVTFSGNIFHVVGVLDEWEPKPKFFDLATGAFNDMEDVYMPYTLKQALELDTSGNNNCWKPIAEETFQAFLNSECVNSQFWIELEDPADKGAYLDFLHNYVAEQKQLGRFPREQNNRLHNVMEWLEYQEVVADDAQMMMYMALMFLVVCLLNTIALLLAKFTGRFGEIALRRAVGASRRTLMLQYSVEAAIVGVLGGLLGLVLAWFGLQGISALYGDSTEGLTSLDGTMIIVGFALAIISSILAALYPTWRACSIAPAGQLKTQ
ncbi:ABC transporter permease [Pseudidiomarina aquimaris]|uniref:ABC transporter permease n=1 Tax=Pseudidiomarina aquimaris TaxID=641841 RepID=UPI003A98791D